MAKSDQISQEAFDRLGRYHNDNFRHSVEAIRRALSDERRPRKLVVDALQKILEDARHMLEIAERDE